MLRSRLMHNAVVDVSTCLYIDSMIKIMYVYIHITEHKCTFMLMSKKQKKNVLFELNLDEFDK